MILSKINIYLLAQISKYFFLILFIFLSVAWLLQITRLFTITNFMYIEIFDIIFLSLYLIPNIITVIIPFILIFGLLLCFIKLNRDNELIAILSLGLGLKPFKNTLTFFTIVIIFFNTILNLYFAPIIYEEYKKREFDLRNTLDISNIVFSNFLKINTTTIIDFEKIGNQYKNIIISFNDENENIIFAKKGNILNENNQYKFQLTDGFKISINEDKQIEKLEFLNYILKVENKNINNGDVIDKNTFTIFDDLKSENYLNIIFKILDLFLIIFVVCIFYINNLRKINFKIGNNIFFCLLCVIILITNQILKNSDIVLINYSLIIFSIIITSILITYLKKNYE